MTPEYWQQLKDAFGELYEAEPSERTVLLAGFQRQDPKFAAELLGLLAADEAAQREDWWPVGRETGRADNFRGNERFSLEGCLGVGGFGVVYRAYDRQEQRAVALKVLRTHDTDALRAFKREFRAVADLRHPNLVKVHELFVEPEHAYFTMELIDGLPITHSLRAELAQGAAPTHFISCVVEAFQQLSLGLGALHHAGIIHRDLKPTNVFRASNGRVTILDFGMVTRSHRTGATAGGGTPAYMAPELLGGECSSQASDWYAVGLMLHEALTGNVSGVKHVASDHRRSAPRRAPATFPLGLPLELPPHLETLCRELRCVEPAKRPRMSRITALLADCGVEQPTTPSSARLPGSWKTLNRRALFGRQDELDQLHRCFQQGLGGKLSIVQVTGRSGMGKSALVQEFLAQLAGDDPNLLVLQGRCHKRESLGYRAFDGITDELAERLSHLESAQLGQLVPPHVSELIALFPSLGAPLARAGILPQEGPSSATATESRTRAFGAFRELLCRIAKRRALVLFVDDAQWGDEDSHVLLRFLAKHATGLPGLLVLAMRSEQNPTLDLPHVTEGPFEVGVPLDIPLSPLKLGDARALVESQLGYAHPLVSAVDSSGEGAPFLLQLLVDEALTNPAHCLSEGVVSNDLNALLVRSIAKLSSDERRLMDLLVVAAQPLRREDLFSALGVPWSQATDIEDLLRSRRLIRSFGDGSVELCHDRFRDALHCALSPHARPLLHRALADALCGHADSETLAFHYFGADCQGLAREHSLIAARMCAKTFAFDRAATHFRRALSLATEPETSDEQVLVELAEVFVSSGKAREAARCYSDAARRDSPRRLELRLLAGQQLMYAGENVAGRKLLTDVLRSAGVTVLNSRLLAAIAFLYYRWCLRRVDRRAPLMATTLDAQKRAILEALWALASTLALVDTLKAAYFESYFLTVSLRCGDSLSLARALSLEAVYASLEGKRAEARAYAILAGVEDSCRETGQLDTQALLNLSKAIVAWMRGDFHQCLTWATCAEELLAKHGRGHSFEFGTIRAFILASQIWLGKFRDHAKRFEVLLEDATVRADSHAETSLVLLAHGHLYWLAKDNWQGAELQIAAALERWPVQNSLSLQHTWALFSRVEIGLYRSEVPAAFDLLNNNWSRLGRATHFRIAPIRIWFRQLRFRTALLLASCSQTPRDRKRLFRLAEREAKLLQRETIALGQAMGAWSRGLLEISQAKNESAHAHLSLAQTLFADLGMQLHEIAVKCALSAIAKTCSCVEQGQAELALSDLGVANPKKMLSLLGVPLVSCEFHGQ